MQPTPDKPADAIAVLGEARRELLDLLAIEVSTMDQPGTIGGAWSVTDLVAHIEIWEQIAIDTIAEWRSGKSPSIRERIASAGGIDPFNDGEVESKRARRPEKALADAAHTHEALNDALGSLSDDEWTGAPAFSNDPPRNLGDVLGRILCANGEVPFAHTREHLGELAALAGRR